MQYTINPVRGSKPIRYQVMIGSIPMSRPLKKADALQYLELMQGNIDSISVSYQGSKEKTAFYSKGV